MNAVRDSCLQKAETKRHEHRRRRILVGSVATAAAAAIYVSAVAPQPAEGLVTDFNRMGTRAFALANGNGYTSPYPSWPNDCTAFVNTTWAIGGGVGQNGDWNWYNPLGTWSLVQRFVEYHTGLNGGVPNATGSRAVHYQNGTIYASLQLNDPSALRTSGASYGDVVWYDWADGGSPYDHVAVVTGVNQYVTSYFDSANGHQYPINANIDQVSQHSANRVNAPWNLGYKQARWGGNPNHYDWTNMSFKTVHVNN